MEKKSVGYSVVFGRVLRSQSNVATLLGSGSSRVREVGCMLMPTHHFLRLLQRNPAPTLARPQIPQVPGSSPPCRLQSHLRHQLT